jgi:hypothetical protein
MTRPFYRIPTNYKCNRSFAKALLSTIYETNEFDVVTTLNQIEKLIFLNHFINK